MIDLLVAVGLIIVTISSVFSIQVYSLKEFRFIDDATHANHLLALMNANLLNNFTKDSKNLYMVSGDTILFHPDACQNSCNFKEQAEHDLNLWSDQIVNSLPAGGYVINYANDIITVGIRWTAPKSLNISLPDKCGFNDLKETDHCVSASFKMKV